MSREQKVKGRTKYAKLLNCQFPYVAKGERGDPTWTRTRVYRVPNMHTDRNAKESGSMAWQSEHKLICSDDHIVTLPSPSGRAPLRFTHSHSSCIHQPYFSHPERPTHKCFTHLWGPSHTHTHTS